MSTTSYNLSYWRHRCSKLLLCSLLSIIFNLKFLLWKLLTNVFIKLWTAWLGLGLMSAQCACLKCQWDITVHFSVISVNIFGRFVGWGYPLAYVSRLICWFRWPANTCGIGLCRSTLGVLASDFWLAVCAAVLWPFFSDNAVIVKILKLDSGFSCYVVMHCYIWSCFSPTCLYQLWLE